MIMIVGRFIKMSNCKYVLCFIAMSFIFSGCASNVANLQRESSRFIGDVLPDTVKISNIKRRMSSVSWDAETSKGIYDCSADDMVRRVHCVKR